MMKQTRQLRKQDSYKMQSMIKRLIMMMVLMVLTGCSQAIEVKKAQDYTDWEAVTKDGIGKTVTILMWGGNEQVNQYMDGYVAEHLKALYNITLNRVPMDAPTYLTKLMNEKSEGLEKGTGDLLWINAENFLTAKEGALLEGPFTQLLPNQQLYYDLEQSDLSYDSGIEIEGYEAIWGRAQLVLTYDSNVLPEPPRTFEALLAYAKAHPGRVTFPQIPDDFAGTAFVRSAAYALTGRADFSDVTTSSDFETVLDPVVAYFKEIKPYLWHEGESYPISQAQQDELFKQGEIDLTMGFEVGKTAGLVSTGVYGASVKTYVLDDGTIGNAHYLAIPYNAPEPAAAMLVIDFLQSPEAQLEKLRAEVWGDMPAFDASKLDSVSLEGLLALEQQEGMISIADLSAHRLPEMSAEQIDWLKAIWTKNVLGE